MRYVLLLLTLVGFTAGCSSRVQLKVVEERSLIWLRPSEGSVTYYGPNPNSCFADMKVRGVALTFYCKDGVWVRTPMSPKIPYRSSVSCCRSQKR